MHKYESLLPRFLSYVKINTRSNENTNKIPSSKEQVSFLKDLKIQLKSIGLEHVRTNESSGYVFATLPSNINKKVKKIGFISHVDTADFNSENVNPQIIEKYDGRSVINLGNGEYKLDPKVFPSLKKYDGQTLITTDGNTLLGADDKAGVTEIITSMDYLIHHPEIKHGEIEIGFGPDEEIGTGADNFDTKDFGADIAYTVDGGSLGQLQYETFNAASATVDIKGTDVHPAEAKGVMVNSALIGMQFNESLPKYERPEVTDGRDGFYFLTNLNGTVDHTKLNYIIRDHDKKRFNDRKKYFNKIAEEMNKQFDESRINIDIKDQYYNMAEVINQDMTVVDLAKEAMKNVDIKPDIFPVRGGTDGSKISFMGLPTPNIFAGGENMHGRFEYVSLQTMEKACDLLIEIANLSAKK
ncbi:MULTISPECIES: peptidase T [Apilactobacillus]|uniref:Peptidase T n=1 Tax=Apilactobacillus micheneri TaxID=1899430 RepID=A0ABY2Z2R7_9LACO|nr:MULTISPECIES: peptidase T [Apilactobacillus]TPR17483.1 peptidase T [Apilactobacillus timberlakei]TPR25627.1 peptidase T [Apilactobacillus micheneri]TPR26731.1 peptidase T [Apilactobacillus micheneri]TPR28518.1 peptidase T [Apilactobacillus micheneri]TPR29205.1 peptidase T [Apilactobacillus micheneri]